VTVPVPVLAVEHRYECPNCDVTHVVKGQRQADIPFHPCRGLVGLNAPLVPAGQRCSVVALEREDYVGREMVQTDGEGRPVMSIRTERWDGSNDLAVLAPCATADLRAQ
jgi:hypothetical protein